MTVLRRVSIRQRKAIAAMHSYDVQKKAEHLLADCGACDASVIPIEFAFCPDKASELKNK